MQRPFINTLFGSKSLALTLPDMIRRRLDFPVPLGPTTARISEPLASKETDLSMLMGLGFCIK
jgi:hypothetical protein